MHTIIRHGILALALLLVPLPLVAQQTGKAGTPASEARSRSDFWEVQEGPVRILLTNRAVLALTSDQVTRLQEIDRQMTELNRPYVAQLFEIRRNLPRVARGARPTAEQRAQFESQMRSAAPLLEKIRENNLLCMKQVGEILTEEQKATVVRLINEERRSDGSRDPRRRSDGARN